MAKYKLSFIYLVFLSVILVLAGIRFSQNQVNVASDLLSLLGKKTIVDDKIRQSASAQQQQLLIVIEATKRKAAQQASITLAQQLNQLEAVKLASTVPLSQELLKPLIELYQNHPFSLLDKRTRQALNDNQPEILVEQFISTLMQAGNPLVNQTIAADPTLTLANALLEKLASQSQWQNDGNSLYQQLADENGIQRYYFPLFITLKNANLGVNQSVVIANDIEQVLTNLLATHIAANPTEPLKIYRSGLLFHISKSTVLAQQEIGLFSTLSMLVIILITLLTFRSIAPLLVVIVVMSLAITFGAGGLVIMVDEIHLITFIFAISLIGISVDYGFHVLTRAGMADDLPDLLKPSQEKPAQKKSLTQYLLPAMLMGSLTTILGYCAMLLMPIEALQQITVFMIFGIIGAVTTALMLLAPIFNQRKVKITPAIIRLVGRINHTIMPLRQVKSLLIATIILGLVILLSGGQLRFDDNIKNLNNANTDLLAQEQKIQQLMGFDSYPRYILISSDSEQGVLNAMEQLQSALTPLIGNSSNSDNSGNVQMLSQWVSPKSQQIGHKQRLIQWANNGQIDQLKSYLDPQQWQGFTAKLDQHLEPSHWPSALNILALPMWQDDNQNYGLVRYYAKLTEQQTQHLTQTMPNTQSQLRFFDQPKRLTESLTQVRQSLLWFFAVSCIGFAIVLLSRYGLKAGLGALSVVIFSAIGALFLSQWLLGDLSIFNLLSCLLIIALAVDYVVFFNEQGSKNHVVLAVLLSAISSMAAFGMMSFSQTPAVYHFGFTTLTGILLAVLLSFVTPLHTAKDTKTQSNTKTSSKGKSYEPHM